MRWPAFLLLPLLASAAVALTEDERLVGLAVDAAEDDNLSAAVTALRQAIAIKPDQPSYHVFLVEALYESERDLEALEAGEAALKRWPDSIELLRSQAKVLLDLDRWSAASAVLAKVLAAAPDDGQALLQLGHSQSRDGKHAEALAPLRRATGLLTGEPQAEAWYELGRALEAAGRWAEATEALEAAVTAKAKYADALELLARTQADNYRWPEVEKYVAGAHEAGARSPALTLLSARAAFGRQPTPESRWALVEAQLGAGEFAAAAATVRAALAAEQAPVPPATMVQWARKLMERQLFELAESVAGAALTAAVTTEARLALGDALKGQERLDQAEAEYKAAGVPGEAGLAAIAALRERWRGQTDSEQVASWRAKVADAPAQATNHNDLAIALNNSRRYDEGESELRQAIALYGEPHATLRHNLANTLRLRGRYAAAGMVVQETLADPDMTAYSSQLAEQHNELGLAYLALGLPERAEREFFEALKLKPDSAAMRLNYGEAIVKQRRFGRAEEALRQAVALPDSSARSRNELGNVLYSQHRYAESAELYREAIAKSPNTAVYHANLAGSLFRLGRRDEAVAAAKEAQQRGYQAHWVFKQLGL